MKLETFVNSHIDPPYFLPRTFILHALYGPCGGPLYESRPSRNNANNAKLPRHDVAFSEWERFTIVRQVEDVFYLRLLVRFPMTIAVYFRDSRFLKIEIILFLLFLNVILHT